MVKYSKPLFLLMFLFLVSLAHAQDRKRYVVYLKDKNVPYTLDKPDKFLTQRALDRRKKQNIAIAPRDLPVSEAVITVMREKGARVWYASRWLNAVLIEADDVVLAKIKEMPQVKPEIEMVSPIRSATYTNLKPVSDIFKSKAGKERVSFLQIDSSLSYGKSYNQAKMLNVPEMHRRGYRGQGMYIAVFDSGFENGDKVPFLRDMREDGRILGTYNFVEGQENVYNTGNHGLEVLSCIGGYELNKFIGTAPEASYYLFRTEDASTEYRVEEFYWLVAAEKADSLGVDVINSSLGYTDYDEDSQDYTYRDMNGKKAMISRAAATAAAVGMVVVNSAGNEASGDWKFIGAPADADSILAVGAVEPNRKRAYFSSYGPSFDRRIKPNVSAQGSPAIVGKVNGNIGSNFGTSFSSPIICGTVAILWQAYPQLTNMEIIDVLQQASSQASKPDTVLGYGIPDIKLAYELAHQKALKAKVGFCVSNEQQAARISLSEAYAGKKIKLELLDIKGNVLETATLDKMPVQHLWKEVARFPKGLYQVRVQEGKNIDVRLWLKE